MSIFNKINRNRKEVRWSIAFIGFIILIGRGTGLFVFSSSLGNAIINIFASIILMGWLVKDLALPNAFQDLLQDLAVSSVLGVSLVIIPGLIVLAINGSIFLVIIVVTVIFLSLLILSLAKILNRRRQERSRQKDIDIRKHNGIMPAKRLDIENLALSIVFIAMLSLATYFLFSISSIWRTYDSWAFLAYIKKYLDITKLDPSNTINVSLDSRVSLSAWLVVLTYIIKLSQDNAVTHYFIYLNPIFAFLAIASFYTFAKELFQNQKTALLATCIQIIYFASSLLYDLDNIRGPGYALVDLIAEDKYFSVWVVVPIALLFAWRFYKDRKRIDFFLFALTATTATLIHPIAYASIGLLLGSYFAITFVWIIVLTIIDNKHHLSLNQKSDRFLVKFLKKLLSKKAMI